MNSGRLDEELNRMNRIVDQIGDGSLLLLNESFSTTSFEEGYYIATDAVRAILRRGMRCIYNTHMHKLAQDLTGPEQPPAFSGACSLIVRSEGQKRSFRIEAAPPEGSSYARDIAEKYGVTYEELLKSNS